MTIELYTPHEVDQIFRYPCGRTAKLVKAGLLAHVTLPDGEVRIRESDLRALIGADSGSNQQVTEHAGNTRATNAR